MCVGGSVGVIDDAVDGTGVGGNVMIVGTIVGTSVGFEVGTSVGVGVGNSVARIGPGQNSENVGARLGRADG